MHVAASSLDRWLQMPSLFCLNTDSNTTCKNLILFEISAASVKFIWKSARVVKKKNCENTQYDCRKRENKTNKQKKSANSSNSALFLYSITNPHEKY